MTPGGGAAARDQSARTGLLPVLIMMASMALIPLGDTAGKLLIQDHGFPPFGVAWFRFTLGFLVTLPFALRYHRHLYVLADWRVYLRGVLIAATVGTILTALTTEDIGLVYGAFFIGPMVSYALAIFFLGERTTPARTALLLLGFAGVFLVVKPGFGMSTGLAFGVLAGIFYGCFLASTRWLAGSGPAFLLLVVQLGVSAVLLFPLALLRWPAPESWPVGLLLLSGLASVSANLLLIFAYRMMAGAVLAPLVYFQLIAAAAYGYVVWDSVPDLVSIAGLALLLVSGFGSLALRRPA